MKRPEYQQTAFEAWSGSPPLWVQTLAAACASHGIPATAKNIGLSADRIRRILNRQDWDNGCGQAYRAAVEKHLGAKS